MKRKFLIPIEYNWIKFRFKQIQHICIKIKGEKTNLMRFLSLWSKDVLIIVCKFLRRKSQIKEKHFGKHAM